MKKLLLNLLSYCIALLVLLVLFRFYLKAEQVQVLFQFSWFQILVTVLLSLGAYLGNGVEYFFISRKFGFPLEKKDVVLLPLAMNFAGTLIPFQGAMAYQLFLFRKKYHVAISQGCAISLFLYLLSMVISGIAGLAIGFFENTSWVFLLVSALFLLSPLCFFCAERILKSVSFPIAFLERIRAFFLAAVSGITALWADFRLIWILILIYVLRLFSMILMFAWVASCLGIQVTFLSLLLLNLWNMLALLIKVTPNNLGISQVVSGVLFAMIGFSVEQGILLSFAVNLFFILVAFSLGPLAAGWHLWEISRKSSAQQ